MNYSPEAFFRLSEEIHRQGGEHLDDMCVAREYQLTGPKGKKADGSHKPLILPGCGNNAIFEIPYEGEDGELRPIHLCAVCDDLGHAPRFAAALEE